MEVKAKVIKCTWCDQELSDDELEAPYSTEDNEILCDECYYEEYEFTCCWCEEHGLQKNQHKILVIFDENEADMPVGVYEITHFPYYTDDMLSMWLTKWALKKLTDLPEGLEQGYYPCGHLCKSCQGKIKQMII